MTIQGVYTGEAETYRSFPGFERPYETEFDRDRNFRVTLPVEKKADALYIDLLDFFTPEEAEDFKRYAGYVNDYLVLKDGCLNHRDINLFTRKLLKKI